MKEFHLGDIQTKLPKYKLNQGDALQWLIKAHSHGKNEKERIFNEKKILRFSCSPDKIASRYSEIGDFTHLDWEKMQFFGETSTPWDMSLEDRMFVYKNAVQHIFNDFYATHHHAAPKHLIHVSCTGYASPSAAQKLVSSKHWFNQTIVTHCYHMGCYAAFPALRIGGGFLLESDLENEDTVDIVHTELCTLHFNLALNTIDQHVVQSLFADGYAKYTLTANTNHFIGYHFKLLAMHEQMIPNTEDAMTWDIGRSSFIMTISKSVPNIILMHIDEFVKKLLSKANRNTKLDIDPKQCLFAIHPGGPKIIECVQNALSLTADKISASMQILKNYGNMSSATLPHVWKLILDEKPNANTYVVSVAFGPGLTVSGSIMKVCYNNAY